MYVAHKRLIARIENDPEYQSLITNKLNHIFHQTSELSSKYHLQRTNERYNNVNTPIYKIIPTNYINHSKSINKRKFTMNIKVLDYIFSKLKLEVEI